jgi:hypothetical protein
MTLLLIVAAWMFVVSLVAGICMAARAGDLGSLAQRSADAGDQDLPTLVWDQADGLEISARSNIGRARPAEPGVAALPRGGIAA